MTSHPSSWIAVFQMQRGENFVFYDEDFHGSSESCCCIGERERPHFYPGKAVFFNRLNLFGIDLESPLPVQAMPIHRVSVRPFLERASLLTA